jgi:hypothetical protein
MAALERSGGLARPAPAGDDPAGMRLDEFLRHCVLSAAAADRRFVRSLNARDVHAGIVVWEGLLDGGALDEAEPAALVEPYLSVSMLYARRFESAGDVEDLALALRYLEDARGHVERGSFADLQARMSTGALLLLRHQSEGSMDDLEAAIEVWTDLLITEAGPLAAANLGRALFARHALTGDPGDLRDSRLLLGMAAEEMPADHPARREIEFALKAAAG